MDIRRFQRSWLGAAICVAALLVTACGSAPGRGVGSQPPAVTLTLANGNEGHEALQPFADGVAAASGGTLTISFKERVHAEEAGYESAIIDDVVAGTYDLAWVAPRPWHAKGVTSFDPLMAPFLIDSYELEGAVLDSELQQQMLSGLERTGVVGLGILPGPLRRIATADGPFRGPADLQGKVVGIGDADIARMTFAALGATTKSLPSGGVLDGVDAVEQQLGSVTGNHYDRDLPYVTTDLAFWPRPLILFANKARFDGLTSTQRDALTGATKPVLAAALAIAQAEDGTAIARLCSDNANLVLAGPGAADRLRTAVQPVYDELRKDKATASMLDRISALKQPMVATAVAPSCSVATASVTPGPAGVLPDGTYEARQSCDEMKAYWAAHPELPAEFRTHCPILMQFTLKNGEWVENYGEHWTYSFFGDHVQLGDFTMRWSFDGRQVTFSEMIGGHPDDAQAWTLKPFTKVPDDTIPLAGVPDGTYRAVISADEIAAFWKAHDVPVSVRKPCPCTRTFTIHGSVWTGGDGSEWQVSFYGDHLTLTDSKGSVTLRWRHDPQIEEVTFTAVDTGDPIDDADLGTYFLVKPFDRVGP